MLSDFHIHSDCSTDAMDSMADMAAAAERAGIDILCFTDHCEIDSSDVGRFNPNCFAHWPRILGEYRALCRQYAGPLDLRLGLELGEINHRPELAGEIAGREELDFVLGSVHNLRDTPDFYTLRYDSEEQCAALLERYLEELYELAGLDCFDCVSHIGYARRYMLRDGFRASVEDAPYAERVDALLRRIVENGRGLEINCSGFRTPGIDGPIPAVSILRRYRELGGEIITTGSDAHRVSDAGQGIARGVEVLKALGYRYYTVFRRRKAEFIRIS